MPGQNPASGGGGGAGVTVTESVHASLASGESVFVTHPAVPLGGADFFGAEALATRIGELNATLSVQDWSRWTHRNYVTQGLEWVKDGVGNGHFSAAPPAAVRPNCKIVGVSSNFRWIVSMGADPTVPGSVELTADMESEALAGIYGTRDVGGLELEDDGNGNKPAGAWFESTLSGLYAAIFPLILTLKALLQRSNLGAGTAGKLVLSPDGGATYYYHDGTAWTATAAAEVDWDAEGCPLHVTADPFVAEPLHASDDGEISTAEWGDFLALVAIGADVRVKVGIKTTDAAATPQLQAWEMNYDEKDLQVAMPRTDGPQAQGGGVFVRRVSSTVAMFRVSIPWGATFGEWRLRVLT